MKLLVYEILRESLGMSLSENAERGFPNDEYRRNQYDKDMAESKKKVGKFRLARRSKGIQKLLRHFR